MSAAISNPEIIAELHRIASEHGGELHPEDVVAAARAEKSPLHPWFQWDDDKAAHAHRLWQARHLISVTVEYVGEENKIPVRVFVSLTTDRKEDGGYRAMSAVLSDEASRHQMLSDALAEMRRFQAKYSELKELAKVFEAMSQIVA